MKFKVKLFSKPIEVEADNHMLAVAKALQLLKRDVNNRIEYVNIYNEDNMVYSVANGKKVESLTQ